MLLSVNLSHIEVSSQLSWLEAEVVRFLHRLLRPVTPLELAHHLHISDRYARTLLQNLVKQQVLVVASGKERARTYKLR